MKEVVKKLVHALEDKATTDLISGKDTLNSNFGVTNHDLGTLQSPMNMPKLSSLHGRKQSQPPPKQYDAIQLTRYESPSKLASPLLPAIAPQNPQPTASNFGIDI